MACLALEVIINKYAGISLYKDKNNFILSITNFSLSYSVKPKILFFKTLTYFHFPQNRAFSDDIRSI